MKRPFIFSFLFLLLLPLYILSTGLPTEVTNPEEIYQLRTYRLVEKNKEHFYDRFKNHTIRIMQRHNFNIVKVWETTYEEQPELVYIIKWSNEQTMKTQWEQFSADQEWIDIKKQTDSQHGKMIDKVENKILTELPFLTN